MGLSVRDALTLRLVNKQFRRVCAMLTLNGDWPVDETLLPRKQWLCGITDKDGPVLFRGVKHFVVWSPCSDIHPRPFGVYACLIQRLELYYTQAPDGNVWTERHFQAIFSACTNLKVCINVGMAVRSTALRGAVTLPKSLKTLRLKTSSMPILFEWKFQDWSLSGLTSLSIGRWYGASDDWQRMWASLPQLSKVRVDDCPHFDTRACEQLYHHCSSLKGLEILDHNAKISPSVMFGGASKLRKLEYIIFDRDSVGAVAIRVEHDRVMDAIHDAVGKAVPFPLLRRFAVRGYDVSASCLMNMLWRSALLEQVGLSSPMATYLVFRVMMAYTLPMVQVYHEIETADI
tara:strand:+ start:794 stop:1828 length:1035 start_codon:yes stop_codon:yes gene_type:complete